MASKLIVYNGALRICGERKLSALTEAVPSRRYLDEVWDEGAVDYCLSMGYWKFAIRSAKLEDNTSISPAFGYKYAFDKPTDYVKLAAFCSDEYYNSTVTGYADEGDYWFSDLDEIYIKYVSNDTSYGNNIGEWPKPFQQYVSAYLANEIIERLTQNETKWDKTYKLMMKRKTEALSHDAMEGPTAFLPRGSWVSARQRGTGGRRDRGSRNSLIG